MTEVELCIEPSPEGPTTLTVVLDASPPASPVTWPFAVTVATVGSAADHVVCAIRFWVLPSLKNPTAVSVAFVSGAIVTRAGTTVIEFSVALLTVSVVVGLNVPTEALIVGVPALLVLVAMLPPLAGKLATVVSEDDHVAILLTSRVLPSLNVPIAEKVS